MSIRKYLSAFSYKKKLKTAYAWACVWVTDIVRSKRKKECERHEELEGTVNLTADLIIIFPLSYMAEQDTTPTLTQGAAEM